MDYKGNKTAHRVPSHSHFNNPILTLALQNFCKHVLDFCTVLYFSLTRNAPEQKVRLKPSRDSALDDFDSVCYFINLLVAYSIIQVCLT